MEHELYEITGKKQKTWILGVIALLIIAVLVWLLTLLA